MSIFAGIDVSKGYLDVHTGTDTFRIVNDKSGIQVLIKKLIGRQVVVEATGGYQAMLITMLSKAKIAFSVINPKRIRDFAKASGIFVKTDKIDAKLIYHFAETMKPEPQQLPSKELQELRDLTDRRKQLVNTLTQEKNRLQQETSKAVVSDLRSSIDQLQKRIKKIDKARDQLIQDNPELSAKSSLLKSVVSVGSVCSSTLLAEFPELGTISKRKAAALAGLAPMNRDSGGFSGKRSIQGGRASVRCALYMATVSAVRFNSQIKQCYLRLKRKGKPSKVALTACMRKLLIVLNAILRDKKSWHYSNALA